MSAALKLDPPLIDLPLGYGPMMTADEFAHWPGDGFHRLHALREGEPVAMAPSSARHGLVCAELSRLLGNHLLGNRPECRVMMEAGVQPRAGGTTNVRVPDLTVACRAQLDHYVQEPRVIVEILSPSNAAETREAVRACLSIPSLMEVLILDSLEMRGEILARGADGEWPAGPRRIGPDDDIFLESLGFRCAVSSVYPA